MLVTLIPDNPLDNRPDINIPRFSNCITFGGQSSIAQNYSSGEGWQTGDCNCPMEIPTDAYWQESKGDVVVTSGKTLIFPRSFIICQKGGVIGFLDSGQTDKEYTIQKAVSVKRIYELINTIKCIYPSVFRYIGYKLGIQKNSQLESELHSTMIFDKNNRKDLLMANIFYGARGAKQKERKTFVQVKALDELKAQGDINAVHDLIGKFHRDAQTIQMKNQLNEVKNEL